VRRFRTVFSVLLAIEALNSLLWASKILSAAAAYDVVVLGMVGVRVVVSALQGASAWMLATGALPGIPLARLAFGASAVLLVLELGIRLSPSSLPPALRVPVVVAYGLYAASCVVWLTRLEREEER
jgi:hypothetical protein